MRSMRWMKETRWSQMTSFASMSMHRGESGILFLDAEHTAMLTQPIGHDNYSAACEWCTRSRPTAWTLSPREEAPLNG